MNPKLVNDIAKKAETLRAKFISPNNIWEAMRQSGIRDNDPQRIAVFKAVAARLREDEEMLAEYERMKRAEALRDAAAHERQQPPDTYRNL